MDTHKLKDSPCGRLVPTLDGAQAFVPGPVPRMVELDSALVYQLDEASRAVSTLAGVGELLPNPYLLIRPFLQREAVLSSKIEGTITSISDLYLFEASGERRDPGDAREVRNYVVALERGLDQLKTLPISLRLVNEVHACLLQGVRGQERRPGQLRDEQNWIRGSLGTSIMEARYVPPPPDLILELFTDWERFLNEEPMIPPLIQCALMHYQFEAIHPYPDGNGRIGRLLIPLFLCKKRVLPTPLLYLSAYFEKHREAYYDYLLGVSVAGTWKPWLKFFLEGAAEQAKDALVRSRRVRKLWGRYRDILQAKRESANAVRLVDELFVNPYVTAPWIATRLKITHSGAQGIVNRFLRAGILEHFGGRWPRIYVARELLQAIEEPVAKD